MMSSTSILVLVLTITIGLLSIGILSRKSYTNPSPVLRAISNNITVYNIWMISWMVYQYFIIHIKNNFSPATADIIINFIFMLMAIIAPIWWYSFMVVIESLLPAGFSKRFKQIIVSVPVVFISLLAISFIWFLVANNFFLLLLIKEIAIYFSLITLLYALVYLIIKSGKLDKKDIRKAVEIIAYGYIIIITAFLLHKIANSFPVFSGRLVLVEVLMELFINIFTVIWVLWKSDFFTEKAVPGAIESEIVIASDEFNIFTKREKEIIQLILQGKPNQEIADELYISLKTVKGHIYNVFQKANVKNRVQLVNRFLKKNV